MADWCMASFPEKAVLSEMHQHAPWVGIGIPAGFTSAQYEEQALCLDMLEWRFLSKDGFGRLPAESQVM